MGGLINGQRFLDAFANVYSDRLSEDGQKKKLMKAYFSKKRKWTEYMLSKKNGILKEVMERLRPENERLEYVREKRFKFDAMFVGGENLFNNNLDYPSELHVLIEHENDGDIEEEMWKLIFVRSPLKVLIFYDWDEAEKKTKRQKIWVKDKLKTLKKMLETVNVFYSECEQTEYLFIIGNTDNNAMDVKWRWASNKQPKLTYLQESKQESIPNYKRRE